jgi:hypothetical protein
MSGNGDSSKNCTITNNASAGVLVLDAFNATTGTAKQVYDQTLKVLPLAGGGNVLAAGATGTVVLDDYTTSNGKKIYNTLYELILARSTDLFPVRNTSVMQSFSPPIAYPPVTVAATDLGNMQLAQQFYQTIMAYPTSNLSQQFQAAMNGASGTANSVGDINKAMAAFFQGTKQYQSLTLNMYIAITTYMDAFPYAWANYQASYTYYLYTSSGSGTANTPPTLVGTLVLTQKGGVTTADPTDHNGGYNIAFVDPSGKSTTLYYSQGQFVSDLNQDVPSICLKGTFVLKSQFTNQSTDNQLIPVISGMVNGTKVLGIDTKQGTGDGESEWYAFWHPKTLQGWVSLFLTVFGVLMALEWAGTKLWGLGERIKGWVDKARGVEPEPSEVEKLRAEVEDLKQTVAENQQELLDKFDADVELPPDLDNLQQAFDEMKGALQDVITEQQAEVQRGILEEQASQLQELAEVEVTPEMEGLANSIKTNMEALQNAGTTEELQAAIEQAKSGMQDISDGLGEAYSSLEGELSAETKQSIAESNDAIEDFKASGEELDNTMDDLNDGDIPEIEG